MKTIQVKVPETITEHDVKLATAIDAFNRKIISLNRSTEIAEIPIQEFLVELKRRDIPAYPYTEEESLRELEM